MILITIHLTFTGYFLPGTLMRAVCGEDKWPKEGLTVYWDEQT
jgi:hypothetical protein